MKYLKLASQAAGVILGAILILALFVGTLTVLPGISLSKTSGDWGTLKPLERLQLEATLRTALLQAVAGALLIAGTITGIRQLRLSRLQRLDSQTVQRMEIYARALSHLTDDNESTRLAGVLLLRDGALHGQYAKGDVVEVLAQFVREQSIKTGASSSIEAAVRTAAEIKTPEQLVDLTGSDLRAKKLMNLVLKGFDFTNADLRGADLTGSSLEGATVAPELMARLALNSKSELHLNDPS